MTIRSLSCVRARVEQLTGTFVRAGCPVYRDDQARVRFRWCNGLSESAPDPQPSRICPACRRTYALSSAASAACEISSASRHSRRVSSVTARPHCHRWARQVPL